MKLERWYDPDCMAVFTAEEYAELKANHRPTGQLRRIYVLDADEEDAKRCENCKHQIAGYCNHPALENISNGWDFPPSNFHCVCYQKQEQQP